MKCFLCFVALLFFAAITQAQEAKARLLLTMALSEAKDSALPVIDVKSCLCSQGNVCDCTNCQCEQCSAEATVTPASKITWHNGRQWTRHAGYWWSWNGVSWDRYIEPRLVYQPSLQVQSFGGGFTASNCST